MRNFFAITIVAFLLIPAGGEARPAFPRVAGSVSLDFHDVDVADVVKSIAEITGKNFILDDRVRGKITMISPTPVTVEEAYEAFISALKTKGLTTVVVGKVTKIIPERESASSAVPFETGRTASYGDQIVTRLIPLKFISVNEIRKALNGLVARRGSIVAYGPTNSLILTDTASNIARLMKIIQKLDKQGFQTSVEVIPIRFAQAEDIADKLTTIFQSEKKSTTRRRRSRRDDVEAGEMVSKIIPDVRTNSLIVTATREGLGRILDIVAELDRKVERALDRGRLHVKYLKHANADELAELLTALLTGSAMSKKSSKKSGGSKGKDASSKRFPWENTKSGGASGDRSGRGSSSGRGAVVTGGGGMFESDVRVVADASTNALVITASPTDYETIAPIIEQLDIRRPQVFVEALIMEVNINRAVEVGISAHGGAANSSGGVFGGTNVGISSLAVAAGGGAGLAAQSGMVLGGMSTKEFSIPGTGLTIPAQGMVFRAMQEKGIVNVLSAPNILTADNKRAEIIVGKQMSFATAKWNDTSGSPGVSFDRQRVALQLAVTPQINDGDEVTLEIEQKIEEVLVPPTPENPNATTTERSATTTVIAQNGQTIVIGGLIKDKESKQVTKVPLLGDIPVLGYLFRSTKVLKEKINLMIFLTPHVIHEPADMTRVSVKKNRERRKFNKTHGLGENKALYDYDLDSGLNMAPPPKRSGREEVRPRRRYNFDQLESDEVQSAPTDEVVERRPTDRSRRSRQTVRDDSFDADEEESPRPRRPHGPSSSERAGNPFSDVRPPSSN